MPLPDPAKSKDDLPKFDGEQALRFQLGAASPLWLMFVGAASAGFAAWSFGRWMKFAAPHSFPNNVVKLRLVKPEPVIEPVAEKVLAPAPKPIVKAPEPVKAAAPVVVTPKVEPPKTATTKPQAKVAVAKPAAPKKPSPKAEAVSPVVKAPAKAKAKAKAKAAPAPKPVATPAKSAAKTKAASRKAPAKA